MEKRIDLHKVERGTLRPPSEAKSLIVRVVRNCPWNRCLFCPGYKGQKFSLREVDEIKNDLIQLAKENNPEEIKTLFLQDADAIIMPVDKLMEVIRFCKQTFPFLDRITAYARSNTLLHKKVSELEQLKNAGLSRIHVGVESGCDEVLAYIQKGTTSEKQLKGCKNVKEAGLELCCYVMPGLGGRKFSEQHAIDTGKLIAAIEPDHVRFRTCFVLENTPLAIEYNEGRFIPVDEEGITKEIRVFLNELKGKNIEIISDHRINLLFELRGQLPQDYDRMIGIIDKFLSLSPNEKRLFIAGRRTGLIRNLDELTGEKRKSIEEAEKKYKPVFPVPQSMLY